MIIILFLTNQFVDLITRKLFNDLINELIMKEIKTDSIVYAIIGGFCGK